MTIWKLKRGLSAIIVVVPKCHIQLALAKLAQSVEAPNALEVASSSNSK